MHSPTAVSACEIALLRRCTPHCRFIHVPILDTDPLRSLACPWHRAHYINTVLPELVDALIHIDMTDALMPLDQTPEWRQGHQHVQQAQALAHAQSQGFSTWEQYQQAQQQERQRQQQQQQQQQMRQQQEPSWQAHGGMSQGDHLMQRKAAQQQASRAMGR